MQTPEERYISRSLEILSQKAPILSKKERTRRLFRMVLTVFFLLCSFPVAILVSNHFGSAAGWCVLILFWLFFAFLLLFPQFGPKKGDTSDLFYPVSDTSARIRVETVRDPATVRMLYEDGVFVFPVAPTGEVQHFIYNFLVYEQVLKEETLCLYNIPWELVNETFQRTLFPTAQNLLAVPIRALRYQPQFTDHARSIGIQTLEQAAGLPVPHTTDQTLM